MSPSVSRELRQHADMSSYIAIAKAFASGNASSLQIAVNDAESKLRANGDFGLAREVLLVCLAKYKLRKIASTYITRTMADIASSAGFASTPAAETALTALICDGDIDASIDASTGLVRFGGGSDAVDPEMARSKSMSTIRELQHKIREIELLDQELQNANITVTISKQYVGRVAAGTRLT